MKILKQILEIKDKAKYCVAGGFVRPLSVAEQRGNLVLYYETNASVDQFFPNNYCVLTVYIVGTGHDRRDIPDNANYIGTVVMSYGLVWHIFARHSEIIEEEKKL